MLRNLLTFKKSNFGCFSINFHCRRWITHHNSFLRTRKNCVLLVISRRQAPLIRVRVRLAKYFSRRKIWVENKISVNAVAERASNVRTVVHEQTFISFNLSVSTRFVESGEDFEHHQTGSPFPSPRAAGGGSACVQIRWRVRKIAYIFIHWRLLRPTLFLMPSLGIIMDFTRAQLLTLLPQKPGVDGFAQLASCISLITYLLFTSHFQDVREPSFNETTHTPNFETSLKLMHNLY